MPLNHTLIHLRRLWLYPGSQQSCNCLQDQNWFLVICRFLVPHISALALRKNLDQELLSCHFLVSSISIFLNSEMLEPGRVPGSKQRENTVGFQSPGWCQPLLIYGNSSLAPFVCCSQSPSLPLPLRPYTTSCPGLTVHRHWRAGCFKSPQTEITAGCSNFQMKHETFSRLVVLIDFLLSNDLFLLIYWTVCMNECCL